MPPGSKVIGASPAPCDGRLVRPFGGDLEYDFAYYIIHRPHAGDEPGIAAIKQWLLAEAGLA
jgi:LysR family glycine cleavage system transcriptional activator